MHKLIYILSLILLHININFAVFPVFLQKIESIFFYRKAYSIRYYPINHARTMIDHVQIDSNEIKSHASLIQQKQRH